MLKGLGNMQPFAIGKILRPRGLSGEVKVQIMTNKPEQLRELDGIEKIRKLTKLKRMKKN